MALQVVPMLLLDPRYKNRVRGPETPQEHDMGQLLIRVSQEYSFPPPEVDWQVGSRAAYRTSGFRVESGKWRVESGEWRGERGVGREESGERRGESGGRFTSCIFQA